MAPPVEGGGGREECISLSLRSPTYHLRPGWGACTVSQSFVCMCVQMFVYAAVRRLITRRRALRPPVGNPLSDRTGATASVCACAGVCVSNAFLGAHAVSKQQNNVQGNRSVSEEGEGK